MGEGDESVGDGGRGAVTWMLGQREKGLQEAGRGFARASPGLLASVSFTPLRRGGNGGSGGAEARLMSADRNSGGQDFITGPLRPRDREPHREDRDAGEERERVGAEGQG